LAPTGSGAQPRHPHAAPPILITEQTEVAKAPPPAVDEREAVPVLARVAVAATTAAPPVRAVPVAAAISVPVTPAAVPATRVAPDGATPETPARPKKYWRKHRTRSAVALFARNSVSTAKRAWEAVWGMLLEWVGCLHRARFPMAEKSPPVSATNEPFKEECWMTQIEFDILEKMHRSAAQKQAQSTVDEEPTRAVAPATPAPSRRYWRKYRLSSTMVVHARNSMSSVKQMWSAVSGPVVEYVRLVDSFVRDCHTLGRDSPVPTPATGVIASVGGSNGTLRSTAHHSALALVQWLREPMRPRRASSRGSVTRFSRRR
jgi:hypothetical protein